jgi:ADP-L-glycero-D-manno-heptose 6-epimerase
MTTLPTLLQPSAIRCSVQAIMSPQSGFGLLQRWHLSTKVDQIPGSWDDAMKKLQVIKGDMRSVVSKAWKQIEETGQVKLFKSYHPDYPDGGQKRDFLYVKDAVAMTLHLASSRKAGGLFNIGSGEANTWLELVHPIFEALGREPRIEFIEMPEALRSQYQYFTRADITKLLSTGYRSGVTNLREAVMDYVSHYLVPRKHFGDGAGD